LSHRGVELSVAFIDDERSVGRFDLAPLKTVTASSVKSAIDKIVAVLSTPGPAKPKSGRKVDPKPRPDARAKPSPLAGKGPAGGSDISVLILGGGEVIPYFKLSNPAFDSNDSVFSDNPYGCPPGVSSADKSLLPERPVGRMPDGNGRSIQLLLTQVETASKFTGPFSADRISPQKCACGYTAAVWKKASRQVWQDIGFGGSLKVCPPLSQGDVTRAWFDRKSFLYFNLHGSESQPYWFGQNGAGFPTALSPASVSRFCREKSMVMTEACYGAIETGRKSETSISLAFLSSGSVCFLGSTCIAYGAFAPPVSEADLIALNFFRNVHKGMAFGKALVKARAQLAALAVSRQGYLDEDDRKTLLQFVLFGDPTLSIPPFSLGSGEDAKDTQSSKGFKKERG